MTKKIFLLSLASFVLLIFAGCGQKNVSEKIQADSDMGSRSEKTTETASESQAGYIDISPEEANQMISENPELIIIDVSPNYAKGHLPRAINYYVGDGSLDSAIPNLDKNAEYLVYCHVDSVSILGSQKLIDAGFKNVYRLKGNYAAWIEAGYPVEK